MDVVDGKNNTEFLTLMGLELFLDHDIEVCGLCFHRWVMREVALELIASGDIQSGMHRWNDEVERRWRAGKFYQLWQAERAAGRDPRQSFTERGWEP